MENQCVACKHRLDSKIENLGVLPIYYGRKIPKIENYIVDKNISCQLVICSNCNLVQQILKPETTKVLDLIYKSQSSGVSTPMSSEGWGKERAATFFNQVVFEFAPKRVLEIGCQDGHILKMLKEKNTTIVKLVGLEPSPQKIDENLGIEFINDYFKKSFFEPKSFDTVMSLFVIEHVKKPVEFLSSIYDVLSDNGQLIISTPNAQSQIESGDPGLFMHEHISYFTEDSLTNALSLAGFKVIKFKKDKSDYYITACKGGDRSIKVPSESQNFLKKYMSERLPKVLNNFKSNINPDVPTVLWGACSTTSNLLNMIKVENITIVDGDKNKQNIDISGFIGQVRSPAEFFDRDDINICISPLGFQNEIESVLKKHNRINYFKLFN